MDRLDYETRFYHCVTSNHRFICILLGLIYYQVPVPDSRLLVRTILDDHRATKRDVATLGFLLFSILLTDVRVYVYRPVTSVKRLSATTASVNNDTVMM